MRHLANIITTDKRLISIGLIAGVMLGIIFLGLSRWLPNWLERPLRAENALARPSEPERLENIQAANQALDSAFAQDYPAALKAIKVPALQGYPSAQAVVGTLYYKGMGVPLNYPEAMRWYKLAADQGNAAAQYQLAMGYATGLGVNKNPEENRRLLLAAAEAGYPDAQGALGVSLFFGPGADRNREGGWQWLRMAASNGNERARSIVQQIQAEAARAPLTPQERQLAWADTVLSRPHTIREAQAVAGILSGLNYPPPGSPHMVLGENTFEAQRLSGSASALSTVRAEERNSFFGTPTTVGDAVFEGRRSGATLPSIETPSSSIAAVPSPSRHGLIDVRSGQYMPPAAGGYTDPRNGTFYAQSGPNGVVNTRTGEFIPTH